MAVVSRFTVVAGGLGLVGIGLLIGCQVPVTPWPGSNSASNSTAVETHYSPSENLEHYDLALLRSAHKSIDLCGFSFTDAAVGDAIESAARRGVRVRVYLDRSQSDDEIERAAKRDGDAKPSSRKRDVQFADGFFAEQEDAPQSSSEAVIAQLAATPNIEVKIKRSRVLMHLKSYAVDDQTLRSGSANFSPSALKRQDNDLVVTKDAASVRRFELDFDQLWSRPDNERLQPQS